MTRPERREQSGDTYVLLGSPGVGKGTQAARLARSQGWRHLSTGDVLRNAVRAGTPLGSKAKQYMAKGDLVPDELMTGIVGEYFSGLARDVGVVLDGYPRTLEQARALDEILASVGRNLAATLLLHASDEVLVKRISGRRSSPAGRVYNIHFDPPLVPGVCDDTGDALVQRPDDAPHVVRNRLKVYRRDTAPLVDHYEAGGTLRRVDGDGDIQSVTERILEAIRR